MTQYRQDTKSQYLVDNLKKSKIQVVYTWYVLKCAVMQTSHGYIGVVKQVSIISGEQRQE